MGRDHQFRLSPRGFDRRQHKSCFPARRSGKYKLIFANTHPMQFLRVVQAQQSIFHFLGIGKFAHYECHVSPCSLDSAGRVQFRKQSNQHALSLTNRASQTQEPVPEPASGFRVLFWRPQ